MARKPTDPASRLPRLEALAKEFGPKEILNLGEMAKALGMAHPSLRELIDKDPDTPVKLRPGKEGAAWEIEGRKFIRHLIKRAKGEIKARKEKAARIARLGGTDFADSDLDKFSVDELLAIDRQQAITQRRKVEQGHFIPLEQHNRVISGILTTIQNEARATRQRIDKAGRFDPDIAAAIDEEMANLLVRTHDKLGELAQDERRAGRQIRA